MRFQKGVNRNFSLILLVLTFNFTMSQVEEQLINMKINDVSAKMFQEVVNIRREENKVISPISLLASLGILTTASKGSTHDELLNAIGLQDDNAVKESFKLISQEVDTMEQQLDLAITHTLFIDTKYELNNQFVKESEEIFQIEVNKLSPIPNNTVKYRRESTDEDSRIFLNSYIQFKGPWKYKFPTDETEERQFHTTIGAQEKIVKVPMMSVLGLYKYGLSHKLKSQVLELPYTDQSSMIIILPNTIQGIVDLIPKIDDSIIDEINLVLKKANVLMYIPKFKIETTFDLSTFLQKMNVNKIFSDEAEIDKLLAMPKTVYLRDATQSALIEINENGKEDARPIGYNPHIPEVKAPIYEFAANHPFVFLVTFNNKTLLNGIYYATSEII